LSNDSLSELLAAFKIDAVIGASKPSCFRKNPDIIRLFGDHRNLEKAYYRQTRIYPIMHLLVIRREIYESHPWIARSLFNAFVDAKNLALSRMRMAFAPRYMLPWLNDDLEEMDDIFGDDPWPYGLEGNRPTLDALLRHLKDDGLIGRKPAMEELFIPCNDIARKQIPPN
jgi:4,5-dihydroxyphthalate decarboxylase